MSTPQLRRAYLMVGGQLDVGVGDAKAAGWPPSPADGRTERRDQADTFAHGNSGHSERRGAYGDGVLLSAAELAKSDEIRGDESGDVDGVRNGLLITTRCDPPLLVRPSRPPPPPPPPPRLRRPLTPAGGTLSAGRNSGCDTPSSRAPAGLMMDAVSRCAELMNATRSAMAAGPRVRRGAANAN